jgi:hypothetical protein
MRAILEGPSTCKEIQHECGLSRSTVDGYIRALHRAGVIHVAVWDVDTNGRRNVASYAWGNKPDAKRYPLAGTVRQQRYITRMKEVARAMSAMVSA